VSTAGIYAGRGFLINDNIIIIMRIRKFLASDGVAVARLHRDTIRNVNSKDYPPEQIAVWAGRSTAQRARESKHSKNRYVVLDNDEVIGFGGFSEDGELTGLYINKDYIGKGIGTRLLNKLENEARAQGFKELFLISTITARNFYERRGYSIVKKTIHKIKDQQLTVYKMKKVL